MRINISRIYDQKYNILNSKIYGKIDVFNSDNKDEPVDIAGYTGQFIREKIKTKVVTTDEILAVVNRDRVKLDKVWLAVRQIDQQRNGFVTNTELDDILKDVYPELKYYELQFLFKPFESNLNRVLIEHKKFK